MYLLMRTDKPVSYVGLHDGEDMVSEVEWEAHRQLSDTLLSTIEDELGKQNQRWADIKGIVIFKGPGSFTGLRIGATVANTLAESLSVPVVGVQGEDWVETGVSSLHSSKNDRVVLPEYGGEANITTPRK